MLLPFPFPVRASIPAILATTAVSGRSAFVASGLTARSAGTDLPSPPLTRYRGWKCSVKASNAAAPVVPPLKDTVATHGLTPSGSFGVNRMKSITRSAGIALTLLRTCNSCSRNSLRGPPSPICSSTHEHRVSQKRCFHLSPLISPSSTSILGATAAAAAAVPPACDAVCSLRPFARVSVKLLNAVLIVSLNCPCRNMATWNLAFSPATSRLVCVSRVSRQFAHHPLNCGCGETPCRGLHQFY